MNILFHFLSLFVLFHDYYNNFFFFVRSNSDSGYAMQLNMDSLPFFLHFIELNYNNNCVFFCGPFPEHGSFHWISEILTYQNMLFICMKKLHTQNGLENPSNLNLSRPFGTMNSQKMTRTQLDWLYRYHFMIFKILISFR